MTQRISVKCDTCEQGIVFRIGVGGEDIQLFSVACPKCKQKIELELILDRQNPTVVPGIPMAHYGGKISKYFNCSQVKEKEEFIAINLHAEMVYPKEFIHEKLIIPSTQVMPKMLEHAERMGFIKDNENTPSIFGIKMGNTFDTLSGDANLSKDWFVLKKAIELEKNGLKDLSNKELKKYSNISQLPSTGKYLLNILFDFFSRFIAPNHKLYSNIEDEFEKARALNIDQLNELVNYYDNNLKEFHIKNYLEIFDEYFTNFKDFNRILLNNKISLHPEEGLESIICPIDFDKVKMYYGNAYEFFTSHIVLLVCTNNILNGRDFDKFQSTTLNKYLKDISKESKANFLKNNNAFKKFTDILESTIRNASHHKWFYIDDNNIGMLKYKSGGTGAERSISYIDYLYKCNEITMALAVVFMIEIYLVDY